MGAIESMVLAATRGMSREQRAEFKRLRRGKLGAYVATARGSIAEAAASLRAHFISAQFKGGLSSEERAWVRSADKQLEPIAAPFAAPEGAKIEYIAPEGERR